MTHTWITCARLVASLSIFPVVFKACGKHELSVLKFVIDRSKPAWNLVLNKLCIHLCPILKLLGFAWLLTKLNATWSNNQLQITVSTCIDLRIHFCMLYMWFQIELKLCDRSILKSCVWFQTNYGTLLSWIIIIK